MIKIGSWSSHILGISMVDIFWMGVNKEAVRFVGEFHKSVSSQTLQVFGKNIDHQNCARKHMHIELRHNVAGGTMICVVEQGNHRILYTLLDTFSSLLSCFLGLRRQIFCNAFYMDKWNRLTKWTQWTHGLSMKTSHATIKSWSLAESTQIWFHDRLVRQISWFKSEIRCSQCGNRAVDGASLVFLSQCHKSIANNRSTCCDTKLQFVLKCSLA